MDAPYYNGPPDEPWPSVEEVPCESCGAGPDELCESGCACAHCRRKEWDAEDALTAETAAVGRGQGRA